MGFAEFFGVFWILTGIFAKHKVLGTFFVLLGITALVLAYKFKHKIIPKRNKKS